MRLYKSIRLLIPAVIMSVSSIAQDKNFHIYLCLGQSNMQGSAYIEPMDRRDVPERFKVMATVDYDNPIREKGNDIYRNLFADLNLNADDIPLLAGEVVSTEQGGVNTSAIHMLGFETTAPTTLSIKRVYVTDTPPASFK